jgi:hypothetical protein
MGDQVAELFVRLAQLAVAEENPAPETGIDGIWTTTIEATDRAADWQIALNCDTQTEHTVDDTPTEGDTTTLRPGSATVWLGDHPAGVVTPTSGAVAVQATIGGPTSIEAELLADCEARLDGLDDSTTGGAS